MSKGPRAEPSLRLVPVNPRRLADEQAESEEMRAVLARLRERIYKAIFQPNQPATNPL